MQRVAHVLTRPAGAALMMRTASHAPSFSAVSSARYFASLPSVSSEANIIIAESAKTPAMKAAGAAPAATPAPAALPPPSTASSSTASSSAARVEKHVEKAAASEKIGSSAWRRFVAFLTGVGVSSVFFYATISSEVESSSAAIERSVAGITASLGAKDAEYRSRIAVLEQEVRTLKDRMRAL